MVAPPTTIQESQRVHVIRNALGVLLTIDEAIRRIDVLISIVGTSSDGADGTPSRVFQEEVEYLENQINWILNESSRCLIDFRENDNE